MHHYRLCQVVEKVCLTSLMRRLWPRRLQRRNDPLLAIRQRGQHRIAHLLIGLQPLTELFLVGALQLNGCHRRCTQYLIEHEEQRAMPFWLQAVDGPDETTVMRCCLGQLRLLLFIHAAQQCQKLAIELAHIAFIDDDAPLVQFTLDLDQLPVVVLVAPADVGQHIQPIGAEGQAVEPHPTGIVDRSLMAALAVGAFPALARHEQRTIQRWIVLCMCHGTRLANGSPQ